MPIDIKSSKPMSKALAKALETARSAGKIDLPKPPTKPPPKRRKLENDENR